MAVNVGLCVTNEEDLRCTAGTPNRLHIHRHLTRNVERAKNHLCWLFPYFLQHKVYSSLRRGRFELTKRFFRILAQRRSLHRRRPLSLPCRRPRCVDVWHMCVYCGHVRVLMTYEKLVRRAAISVYKFDKKPFTQLYVTRSSKKIPLLSNTKNERSSAQRRFRFRY